MPTTSADRHRSRLVLPLLAMTTAVALTACGSTASSAAAPAPSTPATSAAATTPEVTPSDSGSATSSPVATASRTRPAKTGTTSNWPADLPAQSSLPSTDPKYKVGFFLPATGGGTNQVAVEYGKYDPPVPGTDGWGVTRTGKKADLQLAPAAKIYAFCTYAGMNNQGDTFKLCRLTNDQFVKLATTKQKDQQEFWFTVDAQGRPNVLFQLYHS